MKQFFKFFLASLLAMVVASLLFFAVFFAIFTTLTTSITSSITKEEKVFTRDKSILYLDLRMPFRELRQNNVFAMLTGGSASQPSLSDVLRAIHAATDDKNIKGIFIKAGGSPNGLATMEQIRNALAAFKTGGKFIIAYGEMISQSDYYVVSIADQVYVNPLGGLELKGLSSNLVFFKGALDKLEVQPEIFYAGQFKSATEPFRLNKMSEPNRRQLAALQEDVWNNYLEAFAAHAKTTPDSIHYLAANGLVQTATDAIRYNLIEGTRYKDEIEDMLKAATDLDSADDLRFAGISDYARNLGGNNHPDKIALLVAEGQIIDGEGLPSDNVIASETFIKEIRKVRDNDKVKAVVMRVNSPGGSALASEIILRELSLLRAKKPLIVSMGDIAASGGYYISCAADSIFALSNTITGSIGVFGMLFNTQAFFNDKLGVTFDSEKNAPFADFPNTNRPFSDKERQFIQNSVDTIYSIFLYHVANARNMDKAAVDLVGQGRIWTGTDALSHGLVDRIGGLKDAFAAAAALAGLNEYSIQSYPAPTSELDRFLKVVQDKNVSAQSLTEQYLERELGKEYKWFKHMKRMVEQKNTIWMMMPAIPETY